MWEPDWTKRYRGLSYSSVLQKFSGKWIMSLYRDYILQHEQECNYYIKGHKLISSGKWQNFWKRFAKRYCLEGTHWWIVPLGYTNGMHWISYCGNAWIWECITVVQQKEGVSFWSSYEAAFVIWNELGRKQWRHSMAQRLTACYAGVMLDIWSKCWNYLEYSMLLKTSQVILIKVLWKENFYSLTHSAS